MAAEPTSANDDRDCFLLPASSLACSSDEPRRRDAGRTDLFNGDVVVAAVRLVHVTAQRHLVAA
jgi:hypothetical protein